MAKIQLINSNGDELFNESFYENGSLLKSFKDIDIPYSCTSGCCMSCAAKVVEGIEYIDQEKYGEKFIKTDKNTILMCIAGIKDNLADDIKIKIESLM